MITAARFRELEEALRARGYGPSIEWAERIQPPASGEEFASRAIYVICNSGMRVTIGAPIADKCIAALRENRSVNEVYGHRGKAAAIDAIWKQRDTLFQECGALSPNSTFWQRYGITRSPASIHWAIIWVGIGVSNAKPTSAPSTHRT